MLARSFVVASVALCANAFLVVPDVEEIDAVAPEANPTPLDVVQVLDTKQQQITLRCTECPFQEVQEDGTVSWSNGFETTLVCETVFTTAYSYARI